MENTCDYKTCKLYKRLKFKDPSECVNYIESWWTPSGIPEQKPVLIKDCAPRRTFLMIQDLSNRLVGVQKSQEELRNETVWVQVIAKAIGKSKGIDIEQYIANKKVIAIGGN